MNQKFSSLQHVYGLWNAIFWKPSILIELNVRFVSRYDRNQAVICVNAF